MTFAITTENLSKQYQLGELQVDGLLQESLLNWLKHPFRRQQTHKVDNTLWALKNVSLSVKEGEVVGIIGRNGAGKSTLLKVLSRISYPTTGNIHVRGRVAALLEVGTGFHGELTGRENIYLNGSILGMKRKEVDTKLDEIVAFAGVEKFIDTPVKRYSSGMFLRLGFAVAAHLEPDVLIIDEVLAVGDVGFQKKCLNAMSELRSGGRTVLFVSHNMSAVENLCSRVIWIDDGQVREEGNSAEVIAHYMATFATSAQLHTDLTSITKRKGNGDIRFTRIEMLDADGRPLPLLRSGDRVTLRLYYHADKYISYPDFEISLSTDVGVLLTKFSTWINYTISHLTPGNGYLDLTIDCLALQPGRYFLSLCLKSQGPIFYDVLDQCVQFEVETSNYYQTGRGIDSYFGLVFLPCQWHLASGHVLANAKLTLNGYDGTIHEPTR